MTNPANSCDEKHKGLVSKETVLLRRWGVETNVWFIKKVDEVIWSPKIDSSADVSSVSSKSERIQSEWLYKGLMTATTLSTLLHNC